MGKHSEWRKIAKKARRKAIRKRLAQARDNAEAEAQRRRESSPTYQRWLEVQRQAELFEAEEEARLAAEREANWLLVEEEAQKQWKELQKKLEEAREERQKQNAKIRLEWEKEQQKLRELKEEKEREAERKRLEQERLNEEIEHFVANGGSTPEQLKTESETNPGKPLCPFFKKTSTCRFRDSCSRNHVRPGVSRIIIIPNFYSHYSLEKTEDDYGSDSNLEFEKEELLGDYRQFFFDVVPEIETFGKVSHFKACCNHEAHLRGNVYVEFSQTREAVKCYRRLNGRFYGGKQLSVEFCKIESWKSAMCGLFFKRKCPKGNSCNFMHVFKNPRNLFPHFDKKPSKRLEESSEERSWRWSESPERDFYKRKPPRDWEESELYKVRPDKLTLHGSSHRSNGSSRRESHSRSPRQRRRRRSRSHERRKHKSRSRERSRHGDSTKSGSSRSHRNDSKPSSSRSHSKINCEIPLT